MRYLTLGEVLELHRRIILQTRGADGIRDFAGLQSAISQPMMAFGSNDLYPTLEAKASAICFSLVGNHPFVDGNKRIGHAAMETFVLLNGYELSARVEDAEKLILSLASGQLPRDELTEWIRDHIIPRQGSDTKQD